MVWGKCECGTESHYNVIDYETFYRNMKREGIEQDKEGRYLMNCLKCFRENREMKKLKHKKE